MIHRRFFQRTFKRTPSLRATIAVALSLGALCSAQSAAEPTIDAPASMLAFVEVVSDASTDTAIQITNTTNNLRSALCVMIDGRSRQQTNFEVMLPRRQTLAWNVAEGLPGGAGSTLIPPVREGFDGALICIEIDQSGSAIPGNGLIGTTTVVDRATGEPRQATAVGLQGFDTINFDGSLCLGGSGFTDTCATGSEYESCPTTWLLGHLADGTVTAGGEDVANVLRLLPCTIDFFNDATATTTVEFSITNEFEQAFSASVQIEGFAAVELGSLVPFRRDVLGTDRVSTRITSPGAGIWITGTERRGDLGTAAFDLHHVGSRAQSDVIGLPPTFVSGF